jgi:hypothetical protein
MVACLCMQVPSQTATWCHCVFHHCCCLVNVISVFLQQLLLNANDQPSFSYMNSNVRIPGVSGSGLASRNVRTHNSARQIRIPTLTRHRRKFSDSHSTVTRKMSSSELSKLQAATIKRLSRRIMPLPQRVTASPTPSPPTTDDSISEPTPFEYTIHEGVNRNDTTVCFLLISTIFHSLFGAVYMVL